MSTTTLLLNLTIIWREILSSNPKMLNSFELGTIKFFVNFIISNICGFKGYKSSLLRDPSETTNSFYHTYIQQVGPSVDMLHTGN